MKKGNNKIKKLVKSIGICSIIIALMLPTVIGGGPNGPWNFWSNKPHIFNTNTGNIGIGTSTPEEKLHISDGNIRVDNGSYEIIHYNGFCTKIGSMLGTDTSIINHAGGPIIFWTGQTPGSAETKVCITNTGNVGIGTQNPSIAKLQVEANEGPAIFAKTVSGTAAIYGESGSLASTGIFGYNNNGGIAGYFLSMGGSTNPALYGFNPEGGIGIHGMSNGGWAGFFSGDVFASGNVGIGTQTPLSKLDVVADDDVAIGGSTSSGSVGVYGSAGANGAAVHGQNPSGGIGISGYSNGGYAGYFKGDTLIDGDLNLTGTIKGAIMTNIREVSNGPEYIVYYNDYTLFVNAEDEAINIILPQASQFEGRILVIKKVDNTINPMVITPYAEDLIDGFSSWSTVMPFEGLTLQSDGVSHWYIIGGY